MYKNSIKAHAFRQRGGPYRAPVNYKAVAAGTAATAYAAYKGVKYLKDKLNVEYKWNDVDEAMTITDSPSWGNGQIFPLNVVQNGSGASTRDGNQVKFTGITLHGELNQVTAGVQAIRIVIFKMKAPNGQQILPEELFQDTSLPYTLDYYNLDNVPQSIQILSDKSYQLHANRPIIHLSQHIKRDIKTRYQGDVGDYSDLSTNGVYCLITGTGSGSAGARLGFRLRYIDN